MANSFDQFDSGNSFDRFDDEDAAPITGGDLVREALAGATLDFGDELRAGASAALGSLAGQGTYGDLYKVTRDSERQRAADFAKAHPVASTVAKVGGGFSMGLLGGIRSAGTTLGRKVAEEVAKKGLMRRMAAASGIGATTGGVGGAVAGAGSAAEMSDIPAEATKGAVFGTVAGGLLGPAVEGVGTGIRAGRDIARRARDPQYQAAKNARRAIARSGMEPDEALTRADALGPNMALADTSAATRETLETMTQQPGASRDAAVRQLEARSRRQGRDLLDDLGPGKKYETLDALKEFRKREASPLYERAFAQDVPHTQALEDVFNDLNDFAPGLWRDAQKLGKLSLRNEGKRLPDDALGTTRPSLRGWQYMKEELDDRVDSAYRTGDSKKGGALADTRTRLLAELDRLNPTFSEARAKWAGAAQFEKMMDKADRFMTAGAAEFEDMMRKVTPIDREAIKISAIQAIENKIERGQWTQDVAKFFRTPAMERKMRHLFDSAKDFAKFKNKLRSATEAQKTFDAVRGQSATARRLAAAAESNDWIDKAMEAAGDLASPTAAARRGVGLLARGAGRFRPSRSEAARAATAELMLETDPVTRQLNMLYGQGLLNAPMPKPGLPLLPSGVGGLLGIGAASSLLP